MIDKSKLEAAMGKVELERLQDYQSRMTRVSNDILVLEARQKQISINLMGLKAVRYPADSDRSGYDYQYIAKAIRETSDELTTAANGLNDLGAYQLHLKQQLTCLYEYVADRLVAESQAPSELALQSAQEPS